MFWAVAREAIMTTRLSFCGRVRELVVDLLAVSHFQWSHSLTVYGLVGLEAMEASRIFELDVSGDVGLFKAEDILSLWLELRIR